MIDHIHIKDIKKGDIIFEQDYGVSKMEALEDTRNINSGGYCGYEVVVRLLEMNGRDVSDRDEHIPLFQAYDCGAYSLDLYKEY